MRSEAQKRADKKYFETHEINHTTISAKVEKKKAEEIKTEAQKQGITASKYLLLAASYCMEHNITFEREE